MKFVMLSDEELEQFKKELLEEMARLLSSHDTMRLNDKKQWYKSSEVRKMLGISSGKLQQLRITGLLASTKIGGVHYYRDRDIQQMFNGDALQKGGKNG